MFSNIYSNTTLLKQSIYSGSDSKQSEIVLRVYCVVKKCKHFQYRVCVCVCVISVSEHEQVSMDVMTE